MVGMSIRLECPPSLHLPYPNSKVVPVVSLVEIPKCASETEFGACIAG